MKDAYKQELEAELVRIQVKLAEFEAATEKSFTADDHSTHAQRGLNLKQKFDATMIKLKKERDAHEDIWDLLRYC